MQDGKVTSHGYEVTLGEMLPRDVQSTNEDFQKFPLYTFAKVTLCGYSHLTSTSCDHFPTSYAR